MAKNNEKQFDSIRVVGGLLSSQVLREARKLNLPGQSPEDYGIEKGLKFNDELGRYWRIAQTRWKEYREQQERTDVNQRTLAVQDWLIPLLEKVFGFRIESSANKVMGERIFPITHTASNGHLALVLCGADQELEKGATAYGQDGHKRSPSGLLQEYLNAETSCLWGIVSNGLTLRLLRDNPAMTRPAYLEVDFACLFDEDNYADFASLWLLLHGSRIEPREGSVEACWLEQWRNKGLDDGERALDSLRYGVVDALRILGTGFVSHRANTDLRQTISSGALSTDAYFQQVLRLVYRLLFLLTSEDRQIALLPGAEYSNGRKLYVAGYSLSQLRERARLRRHYDHHSDAWEQLQITFAGFATGQPALAQPALGGLFAQDQCPDIDAASLENRYLYEALFKLSFFDHNRTLSRVNYRDMDTEEFGSVYESLLELIPQLHTEGQWRFSFLGDSEEEAAAGGHARKLTGSYYTPDSLVQELVQSALVPVIADRLNDNRDNPRAALLSISVCDPACGSGHFLLAASRQLATELARIDAGLDQPSEADYRHALREVVRHCIYGVDINPMAVELCKTGLWLESIEPGKPLTFLSGHIQCGNALVGILDPALMEDGIPADAYKALSGDDKSVCSVLKKENKEAAKNIAVALRMAPLGLGKIETMPEETVEQVEAKRRAFAQARQSDQWQQARLKEDLFTAAFFASKTKATLKIVPTNKHLKALSIGDSLPADLYGNVTTLAANHRFFHWPLAYPQIFGQEGSGGFDVMLGNPPWDQLQYDPQEFFSARAPEIANAKHMAARKKMIDELEQRAPFLYAEHLQRQDSVLRTQSFIHNSKRYPLTSFGRINLAPLFAELFSQAHCDNGFAGFIVPSGIATDSFTQHFFRFLAEGNRIVSLFDFENKKAIFKGVHRSYKFCLLTIGKNIPETNLVFFASQVSDVYDARRCFSLSPQDFALINPNTKTCPVFRSQMDAEITKKIYRSIPILWREKNGEVPEENPWGLKLQLMFMMNTASYLFTIYEEIVNSGGSFRGQRAVLNGEVYFPLYEAKMVHQYDHRWATYEIDGESSRDCDLKEKQDPDYTNLPRYWVHSHEVTLRTTKAPKPVLDAVKKEDTELLTSALKLWLAGWCLESGDDGTAEELFGEPINGAMASDLFGGNLSPAAEAALQIHAEYPLSDAEVQQLKDLLLAEHGDPWPIVWLVLEERRPKYLLGWRDICRSTDERTVISGVISAVGVGHTYPLIYPTCSDTYLCLLYANLNSIVYDFVARQKVGGTHLTYGYLKQFPTLIPSQYSSDDLEFIVSRALELTYTAHDLKSFAEDLGYNGEPFPFDPQRRQQLKSELDAYYAKLYGLTRDELRYILDPADVMGEDYPSETFRVLKNKELKEYGEYRTQRLVLEAWDRLATAESLGRPYESPLDPVGVHRNYQYSPQAVLRHEGDGALAGLILAMIADAGTVSQDFLAKALSLAANAANLPVPLLGKNPDAGKQLERLLVDFSPELPAIQWRERLDVILRYLEDKGAILIRRTDVAEISIKEVGGQIDGVIYRPNTDSVAKSLLTLQMQLQTFIKGVTMDGEESSDVKVNKSI